MPFDLSDVRRFLPITARVRGVQTAVFSTARTIAEGDGTAICFIDRARKDKRQLLAAAKAAVLIVDEELEESAPTASVQLVIVVEDPKLTFAKIVNALFVNKPPASVHPSAAIDPTAEIAAPVHIGAHVSIGKAKIGPGSVILPGARILDGVTIGSNVTVGANAVIGGVGFGYLREGERVLNFPHIGTVVIEDDVEIGSNTCIDRGALGETRIKAGAKIDNLVHIAHNVTVGEGAFVIAHAMIGGSTKIGARSYIAPCAALRDGIQVGAGTTVGMGAVVLKTVGDNETWTGSPAMPLEELVRRNRKLTDLLAEPK